MRFLSICILFLLYNLPIQAITGDSTAFPVTVPTSVRYLYENDFQARLEKHANSGYKPYRS
ncbi:MAG: hypothetical protein IPQ03_10725 [Bacteroidetes bacterium]|nr:hypothetical protein [Bacteroidota bacterium]